MPSAALEAWPNTPLPCPMTDSSRPLKFDLIAFDWDGTLFDSTRLIVRCIQAAVVDVGGAKPSENDAAWVIGLGLMEALAHAAPDVPKEKYPELGARYRHHYLQHQDDLVLFDGVLQMLDALRARGHKLAVATGKSRRGLERGAEVGGSCAALRRLAHRRRNLRQAASAHAAGADGEFDVPAGAHADDRRHHARPAAGAERRLPPAWA
jgi:hypothetical protein